MIHRRILNLSLRALVLLTFLTAAPLSRAQQPTTRASSTWTGPFFFIQMSDPQFGMFTNNASFERETANYESAIASANRLKPAFVVITGDLINKGQDPAQLAELRRINAKLDPSIPLYLLPGNHDIEVTPTAQTIAFFRKEVGKDYYSWDFGGCHFIGINTTVLFRPDLPEEIEKQLSWLKEDVTAAAANKPKHMMLFGHHPLFVTRMEEPDNTNSLPTFRRKAIVELLTANHAMFMFAGHLHRNSAGKAGDFEMTSTGPVGRPNGNDPSGFRIVKVFEDHV